MLDSLQVGAVSLQEVAVDADHLRTEEMERESKQIPGCPASCSLPPITHNFWYSLLL